MALQLSPRNEARIAEKVESGAYPDADAVVGRALDLLEARQRYAELKQMIAIGVEEVAQGRIVEFTPERREELWQQALAEVAAESVQASNGRN